MNFCTPAEEAVSKSESPVSLIITKAFPATAPEMSNFPMGESLPIPNLLLVASQANPDASEVIPDVELK